MNLEELADDAKKENIIAVVSSMAKVDGLIHENEFVYILKLGLSLGLTSDGVREIMLNDKVIAFIPKSIMDRISIFYYLILLMKVDGEISEDESDLLYHFGFKLGFNHLAISNIIRKVGANVDQKFELLTIVNEVKKYLN